MATMSDTATPTGDELAAEGLDEPKADSEAPPVDGQVSNGLKVVVEPDGHWHHVHVDDGGNEYVPEDRKVTDDGE